MNQKVLENYYKVQNTAVTYKKTLITNDKNYQKLFFG